MKYLFAFLLLSKGLLACPLEPKIRERKNIVATSRIKMSSNLESLNPSTVTIDEFYASLGKIERLYSPEFIKRGWTLKVDGDWEDEKFQAWAGPARKDLNFRYVHISGAAAREEYMTEDALLMTLCHEVGHHLGGFPAYPDDGWSAANEGQSDYFATSKCMKLLLKDEIEQNSILALSRPLNELIKTQCSEVYSSIDEQNLCFRISAASEQMGRFLASYPNKTYQNFGLDEYFEVPPSVSKTLNQHPDAECRMWTYFQGALCNVDPTISFSSTNEFEGACTSKDGKGIGSRPICWFKPTAKTLGNL